MHTIMDCPRVFPRIDILPIVLIVLTGIIALVLSLIDNKLPTIGGISIWAFTLGIGSYVALLAWAIIKTVQRNRLRKQVCNKPTSIYRPAVLERKNAVSDLNNIGKSPFLRHYESTPGANKVNQHGSKVPVETYDTEVVESVIDQTYSTALDEINLGPSFSNES